jgi:hypothetical protein
MEIESYMVKVNIVDYKCRGSFQACLKEVGIMEFVTIHGNKKYFKANYKFYYNISCEFF